MLPRAAVVASTLLLAAGLTGCGHNKNSQTPVTGGANVSASSAAQSNGSGSGSNKTCSTKQTRATIGGKIKCIEAGQECSHKHASDYKQYGFVCESKGSTYVLHKA